MKKIFSLTLIALTLFACKTEKPVNPLDAMVDHALDVAKIQSMAMACELQDSVGMLPRTIDADGNLIPSDSYWWCSGFFPGVLWYLYEATQNDSILTYAEEFTARVEEQKYNTGNHDVGFMLNCSYGNGLRLTGRDDYKQPSPPATATISASSALGITNATAGNTPSSSTT